MTMLEQKKLYLQVFEINLKKMEELILTHKYPILLSRDEEALFHRALRVIKETGDFDRINDLFGMATRYGHNWCQYALFQCWDDIPKSKLYRLVLDVYFMDGYNFPKEAIEYIRELRPDNFLIDLPQKYTDCDELTVYRASTTNPVFIEELPFEISWTTNCMYAHDFYNRHLAKGEKCFLYTGKIKKENLIGFFEVDGVFEVVQLGSVENVRTISYDLVSSIAKEEEKQILAKAKIAKILTGEYSNATLSDWVNKRTEQQFLSLW